MSSRDVSKKIHLKDSFQEDITMFCRQSETRVFYFYVGAIPDPNSSWLPLTSVTYVEGAGWVQIEQAGGGEWHVEGEDSKFR